MTSIPASRTHPKSTGQPPCHSRPGTSSVGGSAGSTPGRSTGSVVQLGVSTDHASFSPTFSSRATWTARSAMWSSALCWAFPDRKSPRLNSSHSQISYAVFCLKKKKKKQRQPHRTPELPTKQTSDDRGPDLTPHRKNKHRGIADHHEQDRTMTRRDARRRNQPP